MMIDSLSPSDNAGGELPPLLALDPAGDSIPDVLAALDPGPVVLLVAAAHSSGWAADAAIALATTWAQAGRRIVLADLHLEEPVLHERLEEANRDGVVDIFLYGASLARSARQVPGRSFYLIPAGTYAADSGAIFRHPRWPKLLAGFRDAHASLLLFAPADAPGLAALAKWSPQAILLGERDAASSLPEELVLLATLMPPAPDGVSTDPASVAPPLTGETEFREPETTALLPEESEPPEIQIEPEVREESDAGPAGDVAEPTMVIATPEVRERERVPPKSPAAAAAAGEREARSYRRAWTVALWVVLVTLGLAAAGYLAVRYRPDLIGGMTGPGDGARNVELASAGTGAPAPPPAPATPAGTELAYAVQLMAFRSHGAAREQAVAEERRLGDQPVYISPELIQGILYYRVLAGMPADSAAALRLRQRLLDAGVIDPEDAAGSLDLIQYAPFAFQLGEFSTRQAALARTDSLAQLGIPSYPAVVPYSDGSERWRLYGGAFRDSLHAEGMRELLGRAGLEPPLVERLGRPSASAP